MLKDKNVIDAYLDREYSKGEIDFTIQPFIVDIDNKKYRYYIETIGDGNYIKDLKIISVIPLFGFDENEIVERQGLVFTNETSQQLLYDMMFCDTGEAGLTKHFREKHSNFDGFFDRNGLPVNYKRYDGEIIEKFVFNYYKAKLDYNKGIYSNIEIEDLYRGLKYVYNLKFSLDEKNFLDDYKMELLIAEERLNYDKDSEIWRELCKNPCNSTFVSKLCGKNRGWDGLPISNQFRREYNSKEGIFTDLNVDYVEYFSGTKDTLKYPVCLHLQDGSKKYYGLIFKLTDTNLIDDIEKIELNVDNNKSYTAEELLKLF